MKNDIVAIVLAEELESTNGRELERALKSRCPSAQILYVDNHSSGRAAPEVLNAVWKSRKVVVAAYISHREIRQLSINGKLLMSFGLFGPSGQLLRQILAIAAEKTAVVALGSPYLIESFPEIQTYVCTYAMAYTSEISAVKALFGEIQNHAKLPVTLPGVARRGFSLPWPTHETRRINSGRLH